MKAKEPTRPILDRKKLREKSYGPEYSPVFRRRNVARGPVKPDDLRSQWVKLESSKGFFSQISIKTVTFGLILWLKRSVEVIFSYDDKPGGQNYSGFSPFFL